jgi:hypothetical protein
MYPNNIKYSTQKIITAQEAATLALQKTQETIATTIREAVKQGKCQCNIDYDILSNRPMLLEELKKAGYTILVIPTKESGNDFTISWGEGY